MLFRSHRAFGPPTPSRASQDYVPIALAIWARGAERSSPTALLDESLEIAMDSSGDFKKVLPDGKVVLVPDHANIERARLGISALHLISGRLAPKKYRYPRR